MATLAHQLPVASATYDSILFGLFGRIAALRERFAKWRLYRQTLAELSTLDARELDDIGLPRGGLAGIAYEAVYGKREA